MIVLASGVFGLHWYDIIPVALLAGFVSLIVAVTRSFWRGLVRGLRDE